MEVTVYTGWSGIPPLRWYLNERPKNRQGSKPCDMWKEELSRRRNSKSRGPKVGACIVSLGNRRPVGWTRVSKTESGQ